MKKRFGKRAVSEVVSYSILIVIAVAISIFVYAFLKLYLPSEKPECPPDTQLTIKSASCVAGNLNVVLENKGLHNVTSAFIRFEKSDKDIRQQIADFLPKQLAPGQSTPPMSFPVADIIGGVYGDYVVEVQTAMRKGRENFVCEDTVVTQEVECIVAPTCGDGICSPTESCPADAIVGCITPDVCETTPTTCSNGCAYTNIASGFQESGRCDDTTGCTTAPCECNGAGQCISRTAPSTCTDVDGDKYYLELSGCSSEPGFLGYNDCNDGDNSVHQTIPCNYDGASCGNYNLCVATCPIPPSEICYDTLDNDCDGSADCLDSDCLSSPYCPQSGSEQTIIYLTTGVHNGNLGGRAGADSYCNSQKPSNLNGITCTNIHAFLSVASNDEIADFTSPTLYNYPSTKPIFWWGTSSPSGINTPPLAINWNDMLDGSIRKSQSDGTGITGISHSGSSLAGLVMSGKNCVGYTSSDSAVTDQRFALAPTVSSSWLSATSSSYDCADTNRIRCIAECMIP